MWKISLITIILSSLLSVPAASQDATNDIICTTVARYWSGTLADVSSIAETPVPVSFRASLKSDGCTRLQLVETSLLQWHRDFGTEATMKASIEYLSDDVLMSLEKTQNIDTIRAKIRAYSKISYYYFLGGESFNSLPLIEKAIEYHDKAKALSGPISKEHQDNFPFYPHGIGTYFHNYPWRSHLSVSQLEYTLAHLASEIYVRQAIITRKEEHYEQANKHLDAYEPEFIRDTLKFAESSVNSVCRTDDVALRKKMEQPCTKTFGLYEEFVRTHLTRKALLATVEDKLTSKKFPDKSSSAFSDVWRLLFREERNSGHEPTDGNFPYHAVYFKLFMAQSDAYFHLGKTESEDGLIYEGLNQLVYAERYVPRHASPSQWRQLAEKYIKASAFLDNIIDDETELNFLRTKRHNQLAYFREGLEALDTNPKSK